MEFTLALEFTFSSQLSLHFSAFKSIITMIRILGG